MNLNDLKDLFWDIVESLPNVIWYAGWFLLGILVCSFS